MYDSNHVYICCMIHNTGENYLTLLKSALTRVIRMPAFHLRFYVRDTRYLAHASVSSLMQSMIKQKGQRCIYYFYRGHIREITTTQHCHACFFVWIKCN